MSVLFDVHQVGRFGNRFFRNICVSWMAKKYNLRIIYCYTDPMFRQLGIQLFNGEHAYNEVQDLTDDNILELLDSDKEFTCNINPNYSYFQTTPIILRVYDYVRSPTVSEQVKKCNPWRERYGKNNDCLIHLRYGDMAQNSPPVSYFVDTVRQIIPAPDTVYLTTDTKSSKMLDEIKAKIPTVEMLDEEIVPTIQFASTCRHVILSQGTFSAVIGYLSYDSEVYFPDWEPLRNWCGPVFNEKWSGWKRVHVQSD